MVDMERITYSTGVASREILERASQIRGILQDLEPPTWLTWRVVLPLIVGTFIVSRAVSTFRAWYRLRHVPGPFLCSISHSWIFRQTMRGQVHEDFRTLFNKYGTTVIRTAPNTVALCDPEALRRINSVRGPYTRGDWYEGFKPIPEAHATFSTLDENHHQDMRNRSAPAYVKDKKMEATMDIHLLRFMSLIEDKYLSDSKNFRPNNFTRTAQYFTLDVVTAIALGEAYGFLDADDDMYGFLHGMDYVFPVIATLSEVPFIRALFRRWPLKNRRASVKDKRGYGKVMGMAKEAVDRHYEEKHVPTGSMIDVLMARGIGYYEIVAEMASKMFGGFESTASAIRMNVACIIATPRVYKALQEELDRNESSFSNPVQESEARALPYLQACIREGLRLYPPSVAGLYKKVPKGGDVVSGVWLPGGTDIGACTWTIGRRTDIWGDDALSYRPERWLEMDEAQYASLSSTVELTFGTGKYTCLGKAIALAELNKSLAELFRRFEISIVNPVTPLRLKSASFYVLQDQWLRFDKRQVKV